MSIYTSDILTQVFQFLTANDLGRIARVNSTFNHVIKNDLIMENTVYEGVEGKRPPLKFPFKIRGRLTFFDPGHFYTNARYRGVEHVAIHSREEQNPFPLPRVFPGLKSIEKGATSNKTLNEYIKRGVTSITIRRVYYHQHAEFIDSIPPGVTSISYIDLYTPGVGRRFMPFLPTTVERVVIKNSFFVTYRFPPGINYYSIEECGFEIEYVQGTWRVKSDKMVKRRGWVSLFFRFDEFKLCCAKSLTGPWKISKYRIY